MFSFSGFLQRAWLLREKQNLSDVLILLLPQLWKLQKVWVEDYQPSSHFFPPHFNHNMILSCFTVWFSCFWRIFVTLWNIFRCTEIQCNLPKCVSISRESHQNRNGFVFITIDGTIYIYRCYYAPFCSHRSPVKITSAVVLEVYKFERVLQCYWFYVNVISACLMRDFRWYL